MSYPPLNADERTTLTAFLDAHRADVLVRLDRVTGEQAADSLMDAR